jgi:hypothetical protein
MPNPYRHTIEELLTRYELEPELRDVFVEGESDRRLLDWFFERAGLTAARTYTINLVRIPSAVLEELTDGNGGNRGRVIALALIFGRELANDCTSPFCLIDKDFGDVDCSSHETRYLHTTDFATVEGYAIGKTKFDKLFQLYFGRERNLDHIDRILDILTQVFAIRHAKIRLGPKVPLIDFVRCYSFVNDNVSFDRDDYIVRLIGSAHGEFDKDQLDATIQELVPTENFDIRDRVNGHDLVSALSWYAREIGIDHLIANEKPVGRAIALEIEFDDLRSYRLFQDLVKWATSSSAVPA